MQESQKSSEKLPAYERVGALLLIFFFSFMILLNFFRGVYVDMPLENDYAAPHYLSDSLVNITIRGAVAKPGQYQVSKKALLKKVLMNAEPLDSADLTAFDDDATIGRRRVIHVKHKKNS